MHINRVWIQGMMGASRQCPLASSLKWIDSDDQAGAFQAGDLYGMLAESADTPQADDLAFTQ
jgi:hypothetical protein